jgi:superfamily II DNA helicase RecQ
MVRRAWTIKEIRDLVEIKLKKRPCWFQVKIALAIYEKNVIGTAATGSGKTLSFWIALLMVLADGEDKMEVIVTPLNLLGKQTIRDLATADVNAIAVSKENANEQTFQCLTAFSCLILVMFILRHRIILVSPVLRLTFITISHHKISIRVCTHWLLLSTLVSSSLPSNFRT